MDYRGLAAPITKGNGGYFVSARFEELVWSSISLILFTPLGSTPGRRKFGTSIVDMVFAQVDYLMLYELQAQIKGAIEKYEPRVFVDSVVCYQQQHSVYAKIRLRIRRSLQTTERILVFNDFEV